MFAPDPIAALSDLLRRLPGIGEKTAQRLALHLARGDSAFAVALGDSLRTLHERVHECPQCGNLATEGLCSICADARRDAGILCVVGDVADLRAIERTGSFRGLYHVLGGLLSPLDGVGPGEIRVSALVDRARGGTSGAGGTGAVKEVIVATPPTVEGEATALYIAQMLGSAPVRLTRIAQGVPHGGEIEYADVVTLGRALEARKDLR